VTAVGREALLDDLDQNILKILSKNCLTPFVRISRRLHVTEGTIRYRVRRLQKKGVLREFRAIIDPVHLGLGTAAFIAVSVMPQLMPHVAANLANLENVLGIYETHTYGDLLLMVRTATPSDLSDFITAKIKTVNGVTGSQVVPVLRVWKDKI
jgi:Lrp/AsnC family transcriptional regulator for asnA, asnC and gidA